MENLLNRKQIIKAFLADWLYLPNARYPNLHNVLTTDKAEQHFILTKFGWNKGKFTHYVLFHIELKTDGQIWVYENRSDVPIEERLVKEGIPKADIIAAMYQQEAVVSVEA